MSRVARALTQCNFRSNCVVYYNIHFLFRLTCRPRPYIIHIQTRGPINTKLFRQTRIGLQYYSDRYLGLILFGQTWRPNIILVRQICRHLFYMQTDITVGLILFRQTHIGLKFYPCKRTCRPNIVQTDMQV